jgi:hypothetical protein
MALGKGRQISDGVPVDMTFDSSCTWFAHKATTRGGDPALMLLPDTPRADKVAELLLTDYVGHTIGQGQTARVHLASDDVSSDVAIRSSGYEHMPLDGLRVGHMLRAGLQAMDQDAPRGEGGETPYAWRHAGVELLGLLVKRQGAVRLAQERVMPLQRNTPWATNAMGYMPYRVFGYDHYTTRPATLSPAMLPGDEQLNLFRRAVSLGSGDPEAVRPDEIFLDVKPENTLIQALPQTEPTDDGDRHVEPGVAVQVDVPFFSPPRQHFANRFPNDPVLGFD